MKAVVKKFTCLTTGIDLSTYYPDNPENFGIWIDFTAGPEDAEGGHDYRIFVCTPTRIIHESKGQGGVFGKDMLVVFEYDLKVIARCISEYVESCTGDNFGEIAKKIGRVASWEFEDYRDQAAPPS
jgi:hypothetical protein